MARRTILPQLTADPAGQLFVEFFSFFQHHKQGHVVLAVGQFEIDDQAILDLGNMVQTAVDLRRADPHALPVEGSIRTPQDHQSAARGDLEPVAVAPDTGKHLEITAQVALLAGIVPEIDRHGGHRFGHNHFAHLFDQGVAEIVPCFHRTAQTPALDLAEIDGQQRTSAHKGRANIGTAAHRAEPEIFLHIPVGPVEGFRRERRAGRPDRAQRSKVELPTGFQALLHAGHHVGSAGAEVVDTGFLREFPQSVQIGIARTAVVQYDRSAE